MEEIKYNKNLQNFFSCGRNNYTNLKVRTEMNEDMIIEILLNTNPKDSVHYNLVQFSLRKQHHFSYEEYYSMICLNLGKVF